MGGLVVAVRAMRGAEGRIGAGEGRIGGRPRGGSLGVEQGAGADVVLNAGQAEERSGAEIGGRRGGGGPWRRR